MARLMVTDPSRLPRFDEDVLVVDLETTAWEAAQDVEEDTTDDEAPSALSPYRGGQMLGVAIRCGGDSFYVPMRHSDLTSHMYNLDPEVVHRWLRDCVARASIVRNANIKFDAHYLEDEAGCDLSRKTLECTTTLAKVVDSDRMSYALDALAKDLLEIDISHLENRVLAYAGTGKKRDYSRCPADIITDYACSDVEVAESGHEKLLQLLPPECTHIWELERDVTAALYDVERGGMTVDVQKLMLESVLTAHKLEVLAQIIYESIGKDLNPGSYKDVSDLLLREWGLPPVEFTKTGSPSFGYKAMTKYASLPHVRLHPKRYAAVKSIARYRELKTYKALFVDKYLAFNRNGVMHPSYNQLVRTGRMSCKEPNAQQLSSEAKCLCVPGEGKSFLRFDYSQIEFRYMAHFLGDQEAIDAFRNDPTTDFHTWVAKMCGIPRGRAKNVNFAIGFGASEKRVLEMLSGDEAVAEDVYKGLKAENWPEETFEQEYSRRCTARAADVIYKYHDRLPTLKPVSREAMHAAKVRGYVRTLFGRRRHLDTRRSYRGFNSAVQGSAADTIKRALIALSPRFSEFARQWGYRVTAVVHDEVLLTCVGDTAESQELRDGVNGRMCASAPDGMSVPLATSGGYSYLDWADCSNNKF